MKSKTAIITIRTTAREKKQLEKVCTTLDTDMSKLMRKHIRRLIKKHQEEQ